MLRRKRGVIGDERPGAGGADFRSVSQRRKHGVKTRLVGWRQTRQRSRVSA